MYSIFSSVKGYSGWHSSLLLMISQSNSLSFSESPDNRYLAWIAGSPSTSVG
jgi:hypothetical protein